MDKTTLAFLAGVGAFAAAPALANTPTDAAQNVLAPRSVAELLEPIANPVETLATLDAAKQLEPVEVADAVQIGPLGVVIGHHHHHHHRHYIYHHHHHHRYYHHHHHHNY